MPQKIIKARQYLHSRPEVSGSERQTSEFIYYFLKGQAKPDVLQFVGQYGVAAVYEGKKEGPTVLFRADIDALPIQEESNLDYKSKQSGVAHVCGHDGHTATLLGVALRLKKTPISTGKVILVFQPAEENGRGAQSVLNDPFLKDLEINYCFAYHNLPRFKKHQIVIKKGCFTPTVKSVILYLKGKTAHAAEPENGINPSLAIADILQYTDRANNNHPDQDDFFLITPVYINMGEKAYGVSAGEAEVHLTLRSWDNQLFKERSAELLETVQRICQKHTIVFEHSWLEEFEANKNDSDCVELLQKVVEKNSLDAVEVNEPFKWGEDFGLFTQKYKGMMFGIGSGLDCPALHNPDYDFPDEILPTAVNVFYGIVKEINDIT